MRMIGVKIIYYISLEGAIGRYDVRRVSRTSL